LPRCPLRGRYARAAVPEQAAAASASIQRSLVTRKSGTASPLRESDFDTVVPRARTACAPLLSGRFDYSAGNIAEFLRIPANRAVELGTRVEI
jgi:hypothetical protein